MCVHILLDTCMRVVKLLDMHVCRVVILQYMQRVVGVVILRYMHACCECCHTTRMHACRVVILRYMHACRWTTSYYSIHACVSSYHYICIYTGDALSAAAAVYVSSSMYDDTNACID